MHPEWPLVGRDAELALAVDALGSGRALLLAGAGGVGKTRLTQELLDRLGMQGERTLMLKGTRAASAVPLAPFASFLPPQAGSSTDALAGTLAALRATAEHGPLAIAVDDAHLLDDLSAQLVGMLARERLARVVLTLRSGEPAPDAVTSLASDGTAERVELQPLGEGELRDLLESALGAAVESRTVRSLFDATSGNVMFVRSLVRDGLGRGSLCLHGGVWMWEGALSGGSELHELVAGEVRALDPELREAVELVALCEPVPSLVLRGLVPPGIVERLEEDGLLATDADGARRSVRLGHPFYGDAVRRLAPRSRLDRLRAAIADELERCGTRRVEDVLRIAVLRLDAGAAAPVASLTAAARTAWQLGSPGLAERLARRALLDGGGPEASYLLAEALGDLGRFDDARDVLVRLMDEQMDDRTRVSVAGALSMLQLLTMGDPDAAAQTLAKAEGSVDDDAAAAELAVMRAPILMQTASPEAALEVLDGCRAPGIPDPLRLRALTYELHARVMLGRFDGTVDRARDALVLADRQRATLPSASLWIELLWWCAELFLHGAGAAGGFAGARRAESVTVEFPQARAVWNVALATSETLAGRPQAAAVLAREAAAQLVDLDNSVRRIALLELAIALATSGDADSADVALSDALGARQGSVVAPVDEHRARAAIHAARGRTSAALDSARTALTEARSNHAVPLQALAALDLARFGAPVEAHDHLVRLQQSTDGELVPVLADVAGALAARDGSALAAVVDPLEQLGLGLCALEGATSAAMLLRREGRGVRAVQDRAASLRSAGSGAVRTPLSIVRDGPDVLTVREREVASLAADGCSDKAIAEMLGVSPRTVNAHLRAVYSKLGIAGRGELTDAL